MNSRTEKAFYCSQLAYKAYLKQGINLNTGKGIPLARFRALSPSFSPRRFGAVAPTNLRLRDSPHSIIVATSKTPPHQTTSPSRKLISVSCAEPASDVETLTDRIPDLLTYPGAEMSGLERREPVADGSGGPARAREGEATYWRAGERRSACGGREPGKAVAVSLSVLAEGLRRRGCGAAS